MVYVPKSLYLNNNNEVEVYRIFDSYFSSDVLFKSPDENLEECREKMQQLGESMIADALESLITLG